MPVMLWMVQQNQQHMPWQQSPPGPGDPRGLQQQPPVIALPMAMFGHHWLCETAPNLQRSSFKWVPALKEQRQNYFPYNFQLFVHKTAAPSLSGYHTHTHRAAQVRHVVSAHIIAPSHKCVSPLSPVSMSHTMAALTPIPSIHQSAPEEKNTEMWVTHAIQTN